MRRLFLISGGAFLLLSLMGLGDHLRAAEYPSKPIFFIVPLEAGSDGDVFARPICQRVSALLGQPLVIINKPGGGSSLGYRELLNSRPDGYTIGWGASTIVTNKLIGTQPFDHQSFTIIGAYTTTIPAIFASTKTKRPFQTFPEVIAFAKAHPREVSIATSGKGQTFWFVAMAFEAATGLQFNLIPQAGSTGLVATQVAGGHTDLGIMALGGPAKAQLDAGNFRFLSLTGSKRAAPPYDNVPCLKEFGYNVEVESTHFVLGPAKMPKDVTEKLVKAFKTAATEQEYQRFAIERYALPTYMPPEEVIKNLEHQKKIFEVIVEKSGILKK